MKMLFCSICEDHKEIDHYDHDEPILECGHTYQETDADKILRISEKILLEDIYAVMREQKVSYKIAKEIVHNTCL